MATLGILVMALYSEVISEKVTRARRFTQKEIAMKKGSESYPDMHGSNHAIHAYNQFRKTKGNKDSLLVNGNPD